MSLAKYIKQPSERKDYDIDYGDWLAYSGDTIDQVETSVQCLTNSSDTSLVVDQVQNTLTVTKLWVSGGTDGARYKITIKLTTTGGRIDESELLFTVKDT